MVCVIALIFTYQLQYAKARWVVGWGFDKFGGFVKNPWASWQMNRSTTAYFVGNASGMDSKQEMMEEVKLGYIGVGWQLNNLPSKFQHLEAFERLESQRLRALRPDVRVGVLRNTEVVTVFWDSARAVMFNNATQDYWTQCHGRPCKGTWVSPAGNTPKYYINFSNPRAADWWVETFVGSALMDPLFDGVYFDCSCGAPMGVSSQDAPQFQSDAQNAFNRVVAAAAKVGKWVSAWNNNGDISGPQNCASEVRNWMSIGANTSLSLQILGSAFVKHQRPTPSPSPSPSSPLPPAACSNQCGAILGYDADSSGIVVPPINTTSDAACCAACRNNSKCEAYVMGPCNAHDPGCTAGQMTCFLVGGFKGMRRSKDRATACLRRPTPPPPPPPPQPYDGVAINNTVAAFLVARGISAMLELPVLGAYEDMSHYVWSPLLDADYGTPLGPGREVSPGFFARNYTRAHVALNCTAWTSEITFR